MMSTYIVFPIMIGLIVVAKPLVIVLLTEKWLPCVVFLQIGCLANMLRPLQFINGCVIRASGRSGLLLKLDIIKKLIGLGLLLFSMNYGVEGIAISLVVMNIVSTFINIAPNRRILNYSYAAQFIDIGKSAAVAVLMGIVVYFVGFIDIPVFPKLVLQVCVGVAFYIGFSIITKNESFSYLLTECKSYLKKPTHRRVKKDGND